MFPVRGRRGRAVTRTYLEGTYKAKFLFPDISQMNRGCKNHLKTFSFPGAIPVTHARHVLARSMNGELVIRSAIFGRVRQSRYLFVATAIGEWRSGKTGRSHGVASNKFFNRHDGGSAAIFALEVDLQNRETRDSGSNRARELAFQFDYAACGLGRALNYVGSDRILRLIAPSDGRDDW